MTLRHHPEALARPYRTPTAIVSYNQGTEHEQHVETPLQQVQRFDLDGSIPDLSPFLSTRLVFHSVFYNHLIILNYSQLKGLLAYSVVHFDIKPRSV
jgi:hypothetical protein